MLDYFAKHFDTVEINNSFYRLPTDAAFKKWHDTVPDGFTFAVKASRFITHMKKLRDPEPSIALFFERARFLADRLGPILFQLPPHWPVNPERLERFLECLPHGHRYVFEFREQSWCIPEIYDILRRHNTAICLHDWGGLDWPTGFTADFTYVRMHGPTGAYHGRYGTALLKPWAERIREWRHRLSRIYIYFNNDIGGHAIHDALTLRGMVGQALR